MIMCQLSNEEFLLVSYTQCVIYINVFEKQYHQIFSERGNNNSAEKVKEKLELMDVFLAVVIWGEQYSFFLQVV